MVKNIRNAFFTGLILLAPVGVTLLVINFLVSNIGDPVRELIIPDSAITAGSVKWLLSLLSMLIVMILITLFGWSSTRLIGKFFLNSIERTVNQVPFIRNVYVTVKQIIDTFSKNQKAVFQQTVLVEYPRKGVYVLGFLTNKARGEVQNKTKNELYNIFVPTTPNPTSGFLLMVPADEVILLDMSVSDGMKVIISGGAVVPDYVPKSESTETSTDPQSVGN
jgi:uncharacterized membrane protein